MQVEASVTIDAPAADVWRVATDIENAAATITAIEKVEVLERPVEGLRGLKWKETRTLYGRAATETMWVTEVDEGRSYSTEARSHGSIYRTTLRLERTPAGTRLNTTFGAEATTPGAKLLSGALGFLIARSVRSALRGDLEDVKAAAESRPGAGVGE